MSCQLFTSAVLAQSPSRSAERVVLVKAGRLLDVVAGFADLIAVPGDPLANISALQQVKSVMKGGTIVRNDLAAASK